MHLKVWFNKKIRIVKTLRRPIERGILGDLQNCKNLDNHETSDRI